MGALSAIGFLFQDTASMAGDMHSIVIAEWIIAVCVLLVVLGLIGVIIAVLMVVRNVEKKIQNITKTVQSRANPLIAQGQDIAGKVQEIVSDLKPKIASVSADVTHITGVVREEVTHITGIVHAKADEIGQTVTKVNGTVQEVNGTAKDINSKSKAQVDRVNGIVSEALTATEQMSRSIQHGIKVPIIKIAGWVATAKSGIENLSDRIPFLHHIVPPMTPDDKPSTAASKRGTSTVAPGGPPFVPAPKALGQEGVEILTEGASTGGKPPVGPR